MSFSEFFTFYSYLWGFSSILLAIYAWCAVAGGGRMVHRAVMTFLVAGGWFFVALYLYNNGFASHSGHLPTNARIWFALHGIFALSTLLLATSMAWARLTSSREGDSGIRASLNSAHIGLGRVVLTLWIFTHAGGIVNLYYLS